MCARSEQRAGGSGRGAADGCGTRTAPPRPGVVRRPAIGSARGRGDGRSRARNEDAAPLPVSKRRCGATTVSEANMRHQPAKMAPTAPRSDLGWTPASGDGGPLEGRSDLKTPPPARRSEPGRPRGQPRVGGLAGAQPGEVRSRCGAQLGEDRATWGSGGIPPGKALRAIANPTESRGVKSDAGWLRGQTTRRRIHRRSDGGPERRQALRRGTRAPLCMLHRNPPLCVKTGLRSHRILRGFS